MDEFVRVGIRIRPLSQREIATGQQEAWQALNHSISLRNGSSVTYSFGTLHQSE
jgi:hypothetical protein